MNVSKLLVVLLLMVNVFVMGCVNSRDPNPCAIKDMHDNEMSCEDIIAEYMTNTTVAGHKIHKNKSGDVQDAVVGILIWPGLADFKNADGVEGNALLDRNIYLKNLANNKCCDVNGWPAQPTRYTKSSPNEDIKYCRSGSLVISNLLSVMEI